MRYIKLYEKMTEWEWYDDAVVFKVFLHLLLTANWKPARWHGIELRRGQRVISYHSLAEELHLSDKQVRTAIEHLRETGEVASKRAGKGQVVTVVNYEKYQDSDEQEGKQEGKQEGNKRATDIEEYRTIELKKEKDTTYPKRKPERNQIPPTVEMVRAYCESRNNDIDAQHFVDFYESKNWFVGKNKMRDWQAAVRTWEKSHESKRVNAEAGGQASGAEEKERASIDRWVEKQRSGHA